MEHLSNSERLIEITSIEYWILPLVCAGHSKEINWMRPPLADQLEDEILDDGEDDFEEDSSGEVESDTIYFGTNGQTAILLSELLGGRGDLEDLEGEVEDDVESTFADALKNLSQKVTNELIDRKPFMSGLAAIESVQGLIHLYKTNYGFNITEEGLATCSCSYMFQWI
ncbi:Oidioi.mRNA.OKI2018_I69.chrUn_7.g17251.t1.cds [Oikopleura dioica]|uniref:Oidioi.mRNA.OKI2018_I69.PAR.g10057.t1.cds n=1 Tax=Oikopleura dioica TaxID=34765 RepID=A0ABN7TBL0_OIKDI|nr:Oidioi.mRNA.OKI2018_I69.PAR.g10057.t1.cds [Oikopleura dioica]CAG5114436.1 Oidioi.mRNA.OKI2018_I69.chrUn_7.g17251.t1.cds [Oikopleura dioica]